MARYWKLVARGGASNYVLVLRRNRALLGSKTLAPIATLKASLGYWLSNSREQEILRKIDEEATRVGALPRSSGTITLRQLKERLTRAFQFGIVVAAEFKFATIELEGVVITALKNVPPGLHGEQLQVLVVMRLSKRTEEQARALVRSGMIPDLADVENPGTGVVSVGMSERQYALLVKTASPTPSPRFPLAHANAALSGRGFIIHPDGSNLRDVPAEMPGSRCLTGSPLPPGTPIFVIGPHPQASEWIHVSTVYQHVLLRGYVQGFRVTTNLPEPTATLHYVQQGERLEPIAARIYHQAIEPGRDLRFYENVVLHVNQQYGLKGARRVDGDVQLVAGELLWLVSVAFANRLQGVVDSGSITGGAIAKAKQVGRALQDILASMDESPNHALEVLGEYAQAILEHLPEIIAVVGLFLSLEGLSALLAVSPTGVGQLAAALIQLGLALFGAKGLVEAGVEAAKHAAAWLRTAWTARGRAEAITEASKSFLRMLMSIAMAALAWIGAKANLSKGLALAKNVKLTPPRLEWMVAQGADGSAVAVPVFQRGSITLLKEVPPPPKVSPVSAAGKGSRKAPKAETPKAKPPKSEPPRSGAPKAAPPKRAGPLEAEPPPTGQPLADAKLEKLVGTAKNWEKVKDFIGRRPPKPNSREFATFRNELKQAGYELYEVDLTGQAKLPFKIRRLKGNAKATGEYEFLTVTDDGLLGLKSAEGGARISVFSRYRKNYLDRVEKLSGKAARDRIAARLSEGKLQLHHLIPDAVAQTDDLIREAYARLKGYTIDRGSNLLDMPTGGPHVEGEFYVHMGSHPNFSSHVRKMLSNATRKLTDDGQVLLKDVKTEAIERTIRKVEDTLREQIKTGKLPAEVLKELQENGIPVKVDGRSIFKLSMLKPNTDNLQELVA